MNPWAEEARTKKAEALATQLECLGIDSEVARWLPKDGWEAAAQLAGVRSPSLTTRELVADLLDRRAAIRRAWAEVSTSLPGMEDRVA